MQEDKPRTTKAKPQKIGKEEEKRIAKKDKKDKKKGKHATSL